MMHGPINIRFKKTPQGFDPSWSEMSILDCFDIFSFVMYGCETWSLTLRDERRLRVFENWVLRGLFGPKRDEVTGELRKLHNEELNGLYCSPNIVRVIKSRRMR